MTRKEQAQKKADRIRQNEAQKFLTLPEKKLRYRLSIMWNLSKLEALQKVARYYGAFEFAHKVALRKRFVVHNY